MMKREFQRLYDQLWGIWVRDPELAEQIKALRIARGLTQNDLAERIGVSQSQVCAPVGRTKGEAARLRVWSGCAKRWRRFGW